MPNPRLFRKEQISRKRILLSAQFDIPFPALGFPVTRPNVKIDTSYSDINWELHARNLVFQVMMNLISSEVLELYELEIKKTYLFGIFVSDQKAYELISGQHEARKLDGFAENLLNEQRKNEDGNIGGNLSKIVRSLFNLYLGKKVKYGYPEKSFMLKVLREIDSEIEGFELRKKEELMGFRVKYFFHFDETLLGFLKKDHVIGRLAIKEELNKNEMLGAFKNALKKVIQRDFKRREDDD